MWLLDTSTARLHEFKNNALPRYAILSHVWQEREQSFQDLQDLASSHHGSLLPFVCSKIRQCCEVAKSDGFAWVWIDTCCINKSSSADLSEAINSMYSWYANAAVCYAFLHDVDDSWDPEDRDTWTQKSPFDRSVWFTRGWTLQELIAPRTVVFLSSSWRIIATKASLAQLVATITGIDRPVLLHERPLEQVMSQRRLVGLPCIILSNCWCEYVSIAKRMSWAAMRKTTREEDRAYSLMGIFGVYMPTIYGEGAHAFFRLQEEILKRSSDHTIFLWGPRFTGTDPPSNYTAPRADYQTDTLTSTLHLALASSPSNFFGYTEGTAFSQEDLGQLLGLYNALKLSEYRLTAHGMRMTVPLITLERPSQDPDGIIFLAILPCKNKRNELAALLLHEQRGTMNRYYVGAVKQRANIVLRDSPLPLNRLPDTLGYFRSVFLPPSLIRASAPRVTEVVLHAFHPLVPTAPSLPPPRALGGPGQPATFAFLIHHRVLERLLKAGIRLDQEGATPTRCHDGLLLEVSQEDGTTAEEHKKTSTFTFFMADVPDAEYQHQHQHQHQHQTPASTDTTGMAIHITIGVTPCSSPACKARAWQDASALSGFNRSGSAPWLTVHAQRVVDDRNTYAPARSGATTTEGRAVIPSHPGRGLWPSSSSDMRSGASKVVTPQRQQQLEPRSPQLRCPRGRNHLPQSSRFTLRFGDDLRSIELDFRRWEGYRHRNNAMFQYTVDVWFVGKAIGFGRAAPARVQTPQVSEDKGHHRKMEVTVPRNRLAFREVISLGDGESDVDDDGEDYGEGEYGYEGAAMSELGDEEEDAAYQSIVQYLGSDF